jgi:arabinofuranosyltransferase
MARASIARVKAERARTPASTVLVTGLAALLAVEVVRTAWVSDDAFVTLRTLDNAFHGLGLRFNPIERVQAYTHPLWLAVLAGPYALSGDAWRAPMITGMVVTALAIAVAVFGVARSWWGAAVGLALLAASKGFVDYATSGLENPLVHLWLALLAWTALRPGVPRVRAAVLLLGFLGLTRPDAVLLGAPLAGAAVIAAWRAGLRRDLLTAPVALAPVALWLTFALVYYGDVVPNPAHAKLGTGIALDASLAQGLRYLLWSARVDPVTLAGLVAGCAAGVLGRDLRSLAFTIAILLYGVFVLRIGGDFMGGRFLVAPTFLAALALSRVAWSDLPATAAVVVLLGASLWSPWSPLRSGPAYTRAPPGDGVVDERGYYWQGTGWFAEGAGAGPTHPFLRDGVAARGKPLAVKSVIGLYGFAAGPDHHVVDRLGLADPLLSRLPIEPGLDWRIGHFRRLVPEGYVASVLGENHVADPGLRALYDDVRVVTRGPLWTRERWKAIRRLTFGADSALPEAREP